MGKEMGGKGEGRGKERGEGRDGREWRRGKEGEGEEGREKEREGDSILRPYSKIQDPPLPENHRHVK